jgi:hypothetical protein
MISIWKRLGLLLSLTLIAWGCVGVKEKYPSAEAKAYFTAANEAYYRGLLQQFPQCVDLSPYTIYLGIKFPPTTTVEVLSEPPSRSYQAFAVLQGPGASDSPASWPVSSTVLAQFINKAKAIGADAIIICRGGYQPASVEAVAIKYRLETPEEKGGCPK